MTRLKILGTTLLALISSTAISGTMGPQCEPGNVSVPCESSAWDIGIQALYLQPSYDADLAYVSYRRENGVLHYNDFDSDWGWGFRLEGSYHFGTGNDVTLNWLHYNKRTDATFIISNIGPNDNFRNSAQTKLNVLNAEFGQLSHQGQRYNVRYHAGLQYAKFEHDTNFTYTGVAGVFSGNIDASFSGIGPRAGIDMSYQFGNGFSIYGNGAGLILFGTSKFSNNAIPATGSKTAASPGLEGKLGAKYNYTMSQGNLIIDAGWQFMGYINALQNIVNPVLLTVSESDFNLQGPYVGIKFIGHT